MCPIATPIVIEDADRMGLAQLYQIRGRVGRSTRKAYAYFTFRRNKVLNEVAVKRLNAIKEFTSFGSGFKIMPCLRFADKRRRQRFGQNSKRIYELGRL